MTLSNAPQTHWSELFGNKYVKTVDPAMLSEAGYIRSQKCRTLDDSDSSLRLVTFDREYIIKYLEMKLIKPMFIVGEDEIIQLVRDAWSAYCNPNEYQASKSEV